MRLLACLAVAAACTDPTFPNDLTGTSSSEDLRLHVELHQRIVDGNPQTHFNVWVSRSREPVGLPPPEDYTIRDAVVEVGGERLMPTELVNERGGHYVADLDYWITNIHVRARVGDEIAEITHAEMLSNPD